METGTRQLVGQGFARDDRIGSGFFALVETLGVGAKTQREVRRLDKCPGQILVAVLGIAFAFLFAVAQALAIDAARIGSELAGAGKPLD